MNLDDLYFKDNFTKDGDRVDLEINKLTAECITSKNNGFSLDNSGNLNVHSITTEVPIVVESLTDALYPVGSIYMNVNPINPNVILGGTWEKIKDTFLLACGDTFSNGATGGEVSHTLSIYEMPTHEHVYNGCSDVYVTSDAFQSGEWFKQLSGMHQATSSVGLGHPHNNMPPYLAVNVWKRIA